MNRISQPKVKKSKFTFSECLLALFIVALVTLDASPTYTHYSNYLGMLFVAVTYLELGLRKLIKIEDFKFVLPQFMFLVFVWITVFLNPGGIGKVLTLTQVYVLFSAIYILVRSTQRTWPIEVGLAIGVLAIWRTQGAGFSDSKSFKGDRLEYTVAGDDQGLNANVYGLYLAMCMLFAVKALLVDVAQHRSKWLWRGRALLAIVSSVIAAQQIIFVTGSRKAQLMMLLILAGGYFIYSLGSKDKKFLKFIVGGGAVIVLMSLVWTALQSSDHFARFEAMLDFAKHGDSSEGSAMGRFDLYTKALGYWFRSPLWGNGPNYFATYSGFGAYSHSNVTEILCNFGLIGLILYYFTYIRSISLCARWFKTRHVALKKFAIWSLTAFSCIMLLFEPFAVVFGEKYTAFYMGVLFGLTAFVAKQRGEKGC